MPSFTLLASVAALLLPAVSAYGTGFTGQKVVSG
jgi:hypothetical protein